MRRIGIVFGTVAILVLIGASPAWAHVVITPSSAPKGSDAVLTFNVANEQESANTTKVKVKFPDDHPIADALVEPVAGWTAAVKLKPVTTKIHTDEGDVSEAVDTITWTAASGGGTKPGGFEGFPVSVGLPDDADSLSFPTIQTYSDGTTVQWIQESTPGGPEPDNPAPELTLTAGAGENAGTTPTTVAAGSTNNASSSDTASQSDVDSAKNIALVALILAAIALIAALIFMTLSRRGEKKASSSSSSS